MMAARSLSIVAHPSGNPLLLTPINNNDSNSRVQVCQIKSCEYSTSSMVELVQHYKHDHELDRPFPCSFPGCSRFFKSQVEVQNHYQASELKGQVLIE